MEWMNQASRPAQPANQTTNPSTGDRPARNNEEGKKHKHGKRFSLAHLPFAVLLVSLTIVIVAVVALLMLVKSNSEERYVDNGKMQAVFLNGGQQVYFGRIKSLNDDYIRMREIYYLRVNQQVQPGNTAGGGQQDISLVKLGCELHGPEDQMLINRDQVVFWENLKSDGQVAKAVEEYVKANPGTQKCETGQQGASTEQNTNESSNTQQNNQNNTQTP